MQDVCYLVFTMIYSCEMSGSHSSVAEDSGLLGYLNILAVPPISQSLLSKYVKDTATPLQAWTVT
jgi:hypothetical protein